MTGEPLAGAGAPLRQRLPAGAASARIERVWSAELPPDAVAQLRQVTPGATLLFPLADGRQVQGTVHLVQAEDSRGADGRMLLAGSFAAETPGAAVDGAAGGGSFELGVTARGVEALLLPRSGEAAYLLTVGADGRSYLAEKRREFVVCAELPGAVGLVRPPRPLRATALLSRAGGASVRTTQSENTAGNGAAEETVEPAASSSAASTPSGPGATAAADSLPQSERAAVLYLDFDGETVVDPAWNSGQAINAAPSGLTAEQIEQVLRKVQEEYRPFRIDVTTSLAAYQAAPVGKRIRCIITASSSWYTSPGVGGVARIGSWAEAGVGTLSATVPCWIFSNNLFTYAPYVADVVAHEAGHTLGLAHDGLRSSSSPATTAEYYGGRGSGATSWGPIMGAAYNRTVTHWSAGDYAASATSIGNNLEPDLAIIASSNNHTGHVSDTVGDTGDEAALLLADGATTVDVTSSLDHPGDGDVFYFAATGTLTLAVANDTAGTPDVDVPNVDATLTLFDAAGQQLMQSNPTGSLYPGLSYATPAPGLYTVRVTAAGEPTMPLTGFPSYGSLGRYRLSGTVTAPAAGTLAPVIRGPARRTAREGLAWSWPIPATGAPTSYAAAGLPAGLTCNDDTGLISGTPAQPGSFVVTLAATNAAGTGQRQFTLNVLPASLAVAVDSPALAFTSGGHEPWETVDDFVRQGAAAVRSGQIMHNSKTSWIETTVTGPGVLQFWWKVSSETGYDYFRVQRNGLNLAEIAGEVDWVERTFSIPAGTQTLRWTFEKDPYASEGIDHAWLDGVRWITTPTLNGPATARVIAGVPAEVVATTPQTATNYTATGLPAGLSLGGSDGVIRGTTALTGNFAVTLRATNLAGSDEEPLALSVVTGFNAWASDAGLPPAEAGPAADPEADGRTNLVEYALGLDPLTVDAAGPATPPIIALVPAAGGGMQLELAFTIPATRPDVRYIVEVTGSLAGPWQAGHAYGPGTSNGAGLPTTEVAHTTMADGSQQVRVRDATTTGGGAARYLRLRIEQL